MHPLFWVNVALTGMLTGALAWRIIDIRKEYTKRVEAVFLDGIGRVAEKKPVPMRDETFTYKKGRYNIRKPDIWFRQKGLLFYRVGKADPINIVEQEKSRMDAEVYEAIIQNEVLKALNRPSFGMFGLSKKQLMYGAAVLVGLYILWQQYGGGSAP